MKKFPSIIILIMSVFFFLPDSPTFGSANILNIKLRPAPDHTRVVIYVNKQVKWNVISSQDEKELTVEIDDVLKIPSPGLIEVHDAIVHEIRISRSKRDRKARLRISLVKPATWDVFSLRKYMKTPARIVVKITRPDLVEREKKRRLAINKLHAKGFKVVIIDPGHGGEDLGAVGRRGTNEKDIVLKVAKQTKRVLDTKKGFIAFLTRPEDYFIPLDQRVEIAKECGADLFVSLHADWTIKKDVKGTSLYCLSIKGATDKGAELLAEKENLSDLIGGKSVERGNVELQTILLDLVQTKTINDSLRFAGLALKELDKVNKIKYDRPKQAAFVVLKSPDIPSVLVEIAYISNIKEEKLMRTKGFQNRFAKGLSSAIIKFFSAHSTKKAPAVKKKRRSKKKPRFHIVKRGEALWKIAANYGVNIRDIQKLNGFENPNHILPGTKVMLP